MPTYEHREPKILFGNTSFNKVMKGCLRLCKEMGWIDASGDDQLSQVTVIAWCLKSNIRYDTPSAIFEVVFYLNQKNSDRGRLVYAVRNAEVEDNWNLRDFYGESTAVHGGLSGERVLEYLSSVSFGINEPVEHIRTLIVINYYINSKIITEMLKYGIGPKEVRERRASIIDMLADPIDDIE